jgi:hypothetical protein
MEVEQYQKEYEAWSKKLEIYHTNRFNKNYKQYTAYTETVGTDSKISDPVAPELVEKVIQKLFERQPKFYTISHGANLPAEISETMSAIADYYWNNPDVVQSSGTPRQKLKVLGREFCITGNTGTEAYYDMVADSPSFRVIPIENIVFNPAKTLKTSERYYIKQNCSLEYLEKKVEVYKKGKLKSGIFNAKAIKQIKEEFKDSSIKEDTNIKIQRSGDSLYQDQVEPIEIISCWEGPKLVQFVNWIQIREVNDPMNIGDDPLDFAMDIEISKQPYALSWLDFINGLTTSKDLILNQVLDYGAKALNPPLFVDPSLSTVSRASLRNAFKIGGIVYARKDQAEHQPMSPLPRVGFELMNYLQQRSESTSGIGAYLSGVPNQANDKTQGTKGGIQMMLDQAVSPVKDRQVNIEESIIEPIINKWMKMTASLMDDNEVKYIFITGKDSRWIQATKGLLSGKCTLDDLLTSEFINNIQYAELANKMMLEGKDPATELVFDVDWIFKVETGSMAEGDLERRLIAMDTWVKLCGEMGKPLDVDKILIERGNWSGIKNPEQYFAQEVDSSETLNEMQEKAGMSGGMGGSMLESPNDVETLMNRPGLMNQQESYINSGGQNGGQNG